MLTAGGSGWLIGFGLVVSVYFLLWSASQMAMGPIAAMFLRRHQRRHTRRSLATIERLASPPLVSIVVPAFNEGLTIVESMHALLALDYQEREIVLVNDGSTDGTLAILSEAFQLVPAPVAFAQPIKTAAVHGIYRSLNEPRLVVVDKVNGRCKADAANAGINAASGGLVLIIDGDTVIEPEALSRAVMPFLEDPATVAVGGSIGIINGCRVKAGRIEGITLPGSWLARFQIIEYMRSFMLFRLACASINAVVLVSGAFGLFRRDAVLAVGGYDTTAIGEDMDLTVRLQQHFRARRLPIRIAFDPNPLGWTQVPEDWRSLRGQRHRWRRGLLQVLWRRRRMVGNPRFGVVGVAALPYVVVFEGLAPLLEFAGYAVTAAAALLGFLNWAYFQFMIVGLVFLSTAITLTAVLLSDLVTRRYMSGRDLVLLVAAALLESCGYRQLNSWWGCVATARAFTKPAGWGVIKRRGFTT
jgi:cellulose synthase/poly-beta-1,6-N-acetylglucosamine synthase-like glycosyltransferase